MPVTEGKGRRLTDGKALRKPNGKCVRTSDTMVGGCCCGDAGTCVADAGAGILRYSTDYPASPHDLISQLRCYRLYVWDHRTVTGNVYGGAAAPDTILATNGGAQHRNVMTVVDDGPFELVQGGGTFLDSEPYWWAACQMGGYATVGSMWYTINLADIDALKTATLTDGTYTLLALVRFAHYRYRYGGTVVVPESSGNVKVVKIRHVHHS